VFDSFLTALQFIAAMTLLLTLIVVIDELATR
jgi:hypothetical protein